MRRTGREIRQPSPVLQLVVGAILALGVSGGVALAAGNRSEAPSPAAGPTIEVADAPTAEESAKLEGGVSDEEYAESVRETVECLIAGGITPSEPKLDGTTGRWSFYMTYAPEDSERADMVYGACYESLLDQVEASWLDARGDATTTPAGAGDAEAASRTQEEQRAEAAAKESRQRAADEP